MSAPRKKPPALRYKAKEEVNRKALVWIGSILGALVLFMALMLILNG